MNIDIQKFNHDFEKKTAQDVTAWAVKEFGPALALASSFGAEDVALIDILLKSDPKARIFTLDTGRLNEETYEVMDRIRSKYGVSIESYFPDRHKVEALERQKGFF